MNNKTTTNQTFQILITGRVQGVGFRPFIYKLASENNIKGLVKNTINGVIIELTANQSLVNDFISKIKINKPKPAIIDNILVRELPFKKFDSFQIVHSDNDSNHQNIVLISPDLAICDDCKNDILDPKNRRYGYAFTNCTNCGPRYTIINNLPYDRKNTTMSKFLMCNECLTEYNDPLNRRFHAQPNACPKCGPGLALIDTQNLNNIDVNQLNFNTNTYQIIKKAANLILDGKIIAIMGIGGFHIACRADLDDIILKLRNKKNRPTKPFALMFHSLDLIKKFCEVSPKEEELLNSSIAPIVLLKKKTNTQNNNFKISHFVAHNNNYLGVMLPYTPLHILLLNEIQMPIIMTSGNITDEPICYTLNDAINKLSSICDFILAHNREILISNDDPVCFLEHDIIFTIRIGRGIAPYVIEINNLNHPIPTNFSFGAILKNTLAFNINSKIFVSQYIGDTDNFENFKLLKSIKNQFIKIYNLNSNHYGCDKNTNSNTFHLAFDLAKQNHGKYIPIQHHYAHILSVMAENNLNEKVIGLAFDGTGLGDDNTIWGSEFLICNTSNYQRVAYFKPFLVQNYDNAVKNISKLTFCALHYFNLLNDKTNQHKLFHNLSTLEQEIITKALQNNLNTIKTSSLGRIFDIIAFILGFDKPVTYEGEAAIWLEMLIPTEKKYEINYNLTNLYTYQITKLNNEHIINWSDILKEVILDKQNNKNISDISFKFHKTITKIIFDTINKIYEEHKIKKICLSGGVFFNRIILYGLIDILKNFKKVSFEIYLPKYVGFGDTAISTGQCYYIMNNFNKSEV